MDKVERLLIQMEEADLSQREQNLDRFQRWRSVPRETGKFLHQMILVHRPQLIVEIGLSQGYSALWMGMAAETYGAKIISYEVEEWRYRQANINIARAELDDTISTRLVSPDNTIYPGEIDFAFIDAEKSDYLSHFQNIHPHMKENGIILADNTLSHEKELTDYVQTLRSHPTYHSFGLSIGKGLEFSRKIGSDESRLEAF